MKISHIVFLFLVLSIVIPSLCSKKKKFKKNRKLPENSVQKRKLVRMDVSPKAILNEHDTTHQDFRFKPFKKEVLGFVTPWNPKGYEYSQKYANKFTMISPVWFEILVRQERDPNNSTNFVNEYYLEGKHLPENEQLQQWMQFLTQMGVEIVPRFRLSFTQQNDIMGRPMEIYEDFYNNFNTKVVPEIDEDDEEDEEDIAGESILDQILGIIDQYEFDGMVIEYGYMEYQPFVTPFMKALKMGLGKDRKLVLVSPAEIPGQRILFGANHFDQVKKYVDFVLVMTYDYRGEGLSPPNWMQRSIENVAGSKFSKGHAKILMGVQFYGYKSFENSDMPTKQPEAVTGEVFLKIVEEFKPKIKWDKFNSEHYFEVDRGNKKEAFVVRFPSLLFIEERLDLINKLDIAGVSIWEVGQGLEYFFDLF